MSSKRKSSFREPPSSTKKRRSSPTDVLPEDTPVYVQRLPDGRREFYDCVEMTHAPSEKYDEDFQNNLDPKMRVRVGDLVAVNVKQASPPTKKPHPLKSEWYPFVKPWSPGQVLSIYQDFKNKGGRKGGELFMMQVRWFFRPNELEKEVEKDEYLRDQLVGFEKDHYSSRTVYETEVCDEIVVAATLGHVHLDSYEHTSHTSDQSTPKLICQHGLDPQDRFQEISDWNDYYYYSETLPPAMLRGLECSASFTQKDEALMDAYKQVLLKRWSDDGEKTDSTSEDSERSIDKETEVATPKPESLVSTRPKKKPAATADTSKESDRAGRPVALAMDSDTKDRRRTRPSGRDDVNIGKETLEASGRMTRAMRRTDDTSEESDRPRVALKAALFVDSKTADPKRTRSTRRDDASVTEESVGPAPNVAHANTVGQKRTRASVDANDGKIASKELKGDAPETSTAADTDTSGRRRTRSTRQIGACAEKEELEELTPRVSEPRTTRSAKKEAEGVALKSLSAESNAKDIKETRSTPATDDASAKTSSSHLSLTKRHHAPVAVPTSEVLHTAASRQFYDGVELKIPLWHYNKSFYGGKKSSAKWKVSVGDVVAISCKDSNEPSERPLRDKGPWFPFIVPWSPGQIVSIYKDFEKKRQEGKDEYKMHVRWLYRWDDLEPETNEQLSTVALSRTLYETEDIDDGFPVSAALGRIELSSNGNLDPDFAQFCKESKSGGRVPSLSFVCRHFVKEDGIEPVSDWDEYSEGGVKSLPAPLTRGLRCSGSPSEGDPKLMKAYIQSIMERREKHGKKDAVEQTVSEDDMSANDHLEDLATPNKVDLCGSNEKEQLLHSVQLPKNKRRDYLKYLWVQIEKDRYAPQQLSKSCIGKSWLLNVGDVVCVEYDDSNSQADHILRQHSKRKGGARLWFPFVKPWRMCQVLSIYREVDGRNDSGETDKALLEIRWLYRLSDLSPSAQKVIPFELDPDVEEVFETDHVVSLFPASSVLGRVELFLGHHKQICNPEPEENNQEDVTVPKVPCRCRYFYFPQSELSACFQSLFCADPSPLTWYQTMLERGRYVSSLMAKDKKLKHVTSVLLDIPPGEDLAMELDKDDGQGAVVADAPFYSHALEAIRPTGQGRRREYFTSVSITPPWDNYHYAELLRRPADCQGDLRWTLRVGDVVALHAEQASHPFHYTNSDTMWYPYSVPWNPCQILAIYRDVSYLGGNRKSKNARHMCADFMVEFRYFYRENDLPAGAVPAAWHRRSKELKIELLCETDHIEEEASGIDSILGPLVLVPFHGMSDSHGDMTSLCQPYMPLALQTYYGSYCTGNKKVPKQREFLMSDIVKRGIQSSTEYVKVKETENVIKLLFPEEEAGSDDSATSSPIPANTDSSTISPGEKAESVNNGPDAVRKLRSRRGSQVQKSGEAAGNKRKEDFKRVVDGFFDEAGHGSSDTSMPLNDTPQSETQEETDRSHESASAEEESGDPRIWTSELDRYHVDFSSLRSYYTEFDIVPDYESYTNFDHVQETVRGDAERSGERWTVKMGDIAIVRWGDKYDKSSATKYGPFKTKWGVGEIVTIWEEHSSKEELLSLREGKNISDTTFSAPSQYKENGHLEEKLKVEVRWLYRRHELPGSLRGSINQVDNQYEEVLETDMLDDCPAESLLAPARLHVAAAQAETLKTELGMPVMDFHCRRFWSIHRKSLVPCGSINKMMDRGMMHSKYLGKDQVLRSALKEVMPSVETSLYGDDDDPNIAVSRTPLGGAFREVIKKLSLTDASEDTNVRGMTLTGRESEQNKIISFLRSAIRGETLSVNNYSEQTSAKSSIFLAGPPGTGKTACVRSVIERLRREQADGDIPEFDFVSLNAMEMRHPFEAYVKLWEALSGHKEKCSPEVAATSLERHFSSSGGEVDAKRQPVTVLLLDEIDYLVTKKQTVLYNFFDWPIRTSTNEKRGPRLVVVGISNTLNLPDRLKPSVQSRLGGERCIFQSYNVEDMVKILKVKIQPESPLAHSVFEDDAILFAARKTAALSGDVRKAFQLCKAAAEAVLADIEVGTRANDSNGKPGSVVRIGDVQRVSRESFSSVLSKAVSLSTAFEALLLVSLASLTRQTGRGNGGFDIKELMTKMESIAGGSGDLEYMPPPTFGETLDMLNRLGEARLVSLHTPKSSGTTFRAAQGGSGGAWPLISLPMEASNILSALRGTPHSSLAEKYLGRSDLW